MTEEQIIDLVNTSLAEEFELDLAEMTRLDQIAQEMWDGLPEHYQWLHDWRWV